MKKALLAFLVLVIAATAWFGWHWQSVHTNDDTLTLYGNVDIRQISLAFDGNGHVTELRAEEGDQVKKGDVLAQLDTRTLAIQARQATAELEARKQQLLRLQNGTRPEELEEIRAQLASAESNLRLANKEFERMSLLRSKQAASQQDVDSTKNNAEVAKAQLTALQATLRLAEIGPRAEDIAAAEAQLTAAQAQLDLLNHQISLGTLHAPTDATVRSRLLEPGDMATPQRPVYALALTEPKWIRVFINETDLGKIHPGMTAQITTDSHPDTPLEGTIGYISSVAEFTPKPVQTEELRTNLVYEVRIIVEDPSNQLRLGQPTTVRLPLREIP